MFEHDITVLFTLVCVIKIGATSPTKPIEYFIFTEQNDEDNCQAYHIFVRDALQFVKRHNSDVAQFMQQVGCSAPYYLWIFFLISASEQTTRIAGRRIAAAAIVPDWPVKKMINYGFSPVQIWKF